MMSSKNAPIVTPVPENISKDSMVFHQRLCRFTREVASVLNSLGLNGSVQLTGLNQYTTGAQQLLASKICEVSWGAPGTLSSNTITISASLLNIAGAPLKALTDLEVFVTDGSADASPSHTATIAAAGAPLGTILDGSGTATILMRTAVATPAFSVTVTEKTSEVLRYLWVGQSGNSELLVTTIVGPVVLTFFTDALWADDGMSPLLADDNLTVLTAG